MGSDEESSSSDSDVETSQDEVPLPGQSRFPLNRADSTVEKAKAHRASFTAPRVWMILLGILLAATAGMVNVIAVTSLGMFVSHTTGTTSRIAERLEGVRTGDMAYFTLERAFMTVFSFMFGAFLCGLVIPRNQMHFGGKQFYGVALLGNSVILITVSFIASRPIAIYLAAMACGLQNAMCTLHLGAIIRTTHVTGTVTDIGSTTGRLTMLLLQKGCRCSRLRAFDRAEIDVDLHKLSILISLWVGFLIGSFLGAWLHYSRNLGDTAFLVPASITGTMAVLYMCFGGVLKRKFKEYERNVLRNDLGQVSQVLTRTRSHLESMQAGQEDDGMVEELEEDVEDILAVMHEVEETLQRSGSSRSGVLRGGTSAAPLTGSLGSRVLR